MSDVPVDFTMQLGIPFARTIRVVGAKNVWPTLDTLEVRAQLRTGRAPSTTLLANLHDHMTAAYAGNDLVITWSMTGAQVTAIDANGYYDVIVSDAGPTDARAIRALHGQLRFENTTTSAEGSK